MDKGGTQTNGLKDKGIDDDALSLTPETTQTDQEKKEEENYVEAIVEGIEEYTKMSKD